MRTILDIPSDQKKRIVEIARSRKISMAELVRQIIAGFLSDHTKSERADSECFGMWSNREADSVEYQRKLREEWEE